MDNQSKTPSSDFGAIAFLIIVSIVASIGSSYYFSQEVSKKLVGTPTVVQSPSGTATTTSTVSVADQVVAKILENEYAKSGGKENYDLMAKAQKYSFEENLPQIKDYIRKKENTGAANGSNTGAVAENTPPEASPSEKNEEKKNQLDVFIMSYCPFGEIAMQQFPALLKQFKADGTKFDVHYIANGSGKKASDFQSLHGVPEAEENIRQLCIKKKYGVEKLVDYMMVRYAKADNYGRVTEGPESAYAAIKADAKWVNGCVENGEGGALLSEDIKIAEQNGVSASPTWLANNKFQFGGISAKDISSQFCANNKDLKGCKEVVADAGNSGSEPNPAANVKCATN